MKLLQCFGICASLQSLVASVHAASSPLAFNISSDQFDNVQIGSVFEISWVSPEPVTLSVLNATTYSAYLILGSMSKFPYS